MTVAVDWDLKNQTKQTSQKFNKSIFRLETHNQRSKNSGDLDEISH